MGGRKRAREGGGVHGREKESWGGGMLEREGGWGRKGACVVWEKNIWCLVSVVFIIN